jgi:threonine/homoserine/homoserine lactone efflux protein
MGPIGQLSGFISGMGAATADSFFALVAGLGIGFLASFFEEQRLWLMLIGGGILIFLGLRLFFNNILETVRHPKRNKKGFIGDFASVFFLTLSNPLTIIFFGAILAGWNVLSAGPWHALWAIAGIFTGAMIWWGILTTLVHAFRDKFSLRRLVMLNKIAGLIIAGFGVFALISPLF